MEFLETSKSQKQGILIDGLPGFVWVKIDEKPRKINILGGRKRGF